MTTTVPTESPRLPLPAPLAEALALKQLPGLDALRAFAALLVVFYHQGFPVPGDLGVLAFFVLSGFLITWLLLTEQSRYGGISLKLFYIRRSLRIFPAFYAYWLLGVVLLTVGHKQIRWPQVWAFFFYVNNYYQALYGHFSSFVSHTWSLGVEEQFYLIWPLALMGLFRRRADIVWWLMGAIGVVWVWRAVLELGIQIQEVWLYEAFDARADHLLIGCLLAVALYQKRAPRLFAWLCSSPAMPAITLALLIGECVVTHHAGKIGVRWIEFIVQPLLVAALITQWMAFSHCTALWSWLNWGWLVYLGKISYSTYLYQQLAPSLIKPVLARLPMVPEILIILPSIIAAASASYFFIEKPFLTLKDRFRRGGGH